MESGILLSESNRNSFTSENRSSSMTILSTISSINNGQPRMAQLETLEAKMASIEVSLSSNATRRRKGTSLGGGISNSCSARTSPRPDSHLHGGTKELRSALQDREDVIQNLRLKLGLEKLPRPSGTPLDESEKPAAEQRLNRLRIDVENKRIAIRNLKTALEKLDITDNIDIRIRQAELEYALGREELQLLSLVEESRALQARLVDKSTKLKDVTNSLFTILQSGANLTLQAVQTTVGRWTVNNSTTLNKSQNSLNDLWIEWALDGEGLYRGDRLLEVNGKIVLQKTNEELQKILGTNGTKCQIVVLRKRSAPLQQQQLLQFQEDNQRLQHRISYLEDQVKELQSNKDIIQISSLSSSSASSTINDGNLDVSSVGGGGVLEKNEEIHNGQINVTSISISTPSITTSTTNSTAEKPQIFQRGNFITTIIGGKPVDLPPTNLPSKQNVTKTIIKENYANGNFNYQNTVMNDSSSGGGGGGGYIRSNMSSRISINNDLAQLKYRERQKDLRKDELKEKHHYHQHQQEHQQFKQPQQNGRFKNDIPKHYHSIEFLNHYNSSNNNHLDKRKDYIIEQKTKSRLAQQYNHNSNGINNYCSNGIRSITPYDLRSVKSLDFDSDAGGGGGGGSVSCSNGAISNGSVDHQHYQLQQNLYHQYQQRKREVDYTSEPVVTNKIRPTPPKKPLRLSLQRAQSLQTVEANNLENDKKRATKRTYKNSKSPERNNNHHQQYLENTLTIPFQTASLGRNKYI